jgi:hypothetical protein
MDTVWHIAIEVAVLSILPCFILRLISVRICKLNYEFKYAAGVFSIFVF